MNSFDTSILYFLNSFSGKSGLFDATVIFITNSTFLRAALLTGMLVWLWFGPDESRKATREGVVVILISTALALVFVKILRFFLPYRLRPLHNPDLAFTLPAGVDDRTLFGWSSFPSDTAAFFFALAGGICFLSRRMGLVALLYSFIFSCFGRMYLGYHYPTDILAGMMVGLLFGYAAFRPSVRKALAAVPMQWLGSRPQAFYTVFFLVLIEFTNVFEGVRSVLVFIDKSMH